MAMTRVGGFTTALAAASGALAVAWAMGASADPAQNAPGSMAGMSMPATATPVGTPATVEGWAKGAQIFPGLGDFHRQATTNSAEAQAYFDQGMRFTWAFNHDEATRSFAKAAMLDPTCAACWWGVALSLGPNYNMPLMADPRGRVGWQAVQRARALEAGASPVERALIEAVAQRFAGPAPLDPAAASARLTAYATAMKAVADRFPDDLDVQVLTAEAQMNVNPWKLWNLDGTPAPGTLEIVARLEGVLAKDPLHPGANHYYVHALEASPHPEKALVEANRLAALMPQAGHIVHMPAHILQRVGRYEDAAEANRRAAVVDAAYYRMTAAPDYYPMYSAHNFQFLAFSAAMEGRRAETLAALKQARLLLTDDMLQGMPGVDWVVGDLYQGMVRFGLWDEILAQPAPSADLPGLRAAWLEARAIAYAKTGHIAEATAVAGELQQLIAATPADRPAGYNSARDMMTLGLILAKANIALARKDTGAGVALLREAVRREDQLAYDEPADAFFPARHQLGAALLAAGDPAGAEAVYRSDLLLNPANGWALKGLGLALVAQGRTAEAADAHRRFEAAWVHADVDPPGSAY
jgi:tetratricopeptide (TPR) repeat protein